MHTVRGIFLKCYNMYILPAFSYFNAIYVILWFEFRSSFGHFFFCWVGQSVQNLERTIYLEYSSTKHLLSPLVLEKVPHYFWLILNNIQFITGLDINLKKKITTHCQKNAFYQIRKKETRPTNQTCIIKNKLGKRAITLTDSGQRLIFKKKAIVELC